MAEIAPFGPRPPQIDWPLPPGRLASLLRPLALAATGMAAQEQNLEVISQNLANAETTRTSEGGPYRRQSVVLAPDGHGGVQVIRVAEDTTPGRSVYNPGHPDADQNGYVKYPNVDITSELVDLTIARRVYEANATVFQAAKAMLQRAIDI
jgi:flagellar basal-body rod protein FlgC